MLRRGLFPVKWKDGVDRLASLLHRCCCCWRSVIATTTKVLDLCFVLLARRAELTSETKEFLSRTFQFLARSDQALTLPSTYSRHEGSSPGICCNLFPLPPLHLAGWMQAHEQKLASLVDCCRALLWCRRWQTHLRTFAQTRYSCIFLLDVGVCVLEDNERTRLMGTISMISHLKVLRGFFLLFV